MIRTRACCLFFLITAVSAARADWPQWRGPSRDGVSTDTSPVASSFPETGLKKVWESEFIPSDHYGGHGSPVIAGERAFLSVVWHERVPSEVREIDTEVMQQLNHRGVNEELAKKMEEARLTMSPRLRGEKLEEWITAWTDANLSDKEKVSLASWVASRFRAGRTALPLGDLDKVSKRQGKPFPNLAAMKEWMVAEGLSPEVQEKLLSSVPNTIKVAKDAVVCLDMATGKQAWKFEAEGKPTGRKSSSTAAVVDGRVYAVGSTHLYCLDEKDGTLKWRTALPSEGAAASPLVVGERVYLAAGSAVALDTAEGKTVWDQKKVRGDTSSAQLWKPASAEEVLVINGNGGLYGLRPADGEVLWTVEGGGQSTPVMDGDWLVIYSGTKDVGLRAYKAKAGGAPEVVWSNFWVTLRYTGSPIIHEGHVYLCCGGKHQCVELESGKVKWSETVNSTITSPLIVDGKLLVLENNGTHLRMIKTDPAAYQQLGRAKADAMGCTSPALSNGRIVVRNKEKLICYDLRPEK